MPAALFFLESRSVGAGLPTGEGCVVNTQTGPKEPGSVRTAAKHVKNTDWREFFHAAAVTPGGERSWISAESQQR